MRTTHNSEQDQSSSSLGETQTPVQLQAMNIKEAKIIPTHEQNLLHHKSIALCQRVGKESLGGCLPRPACALSKRRFRISVDHLTNYHASSKNHEMTRKQILTLIEKRLYFAAEQDGQGPSPTLAPALERYLYATATSFEAYADYTTLNSRLRLVTVALLQRRLQKSRKRDRPEVLKEYLGVHKYEIVLRLVNDIKALRLAWISLNCASCRTDGACTAPTLSAQKVIPQAVRNLFFETTLLQAVALIPVERIPLLPWDAMIATAKSNIRAFEEWTRGHK